MLPSHVRVAKREALDAMSTSVGDERMRETMSSNMSWVQRSPENFSLTARLMSHFLAVGESRLDTISTNIARIVAVEGPVLGDRLHQAYVKAAGGQTVGKKTAHILNQAITSAERRGMIVSDNPLNEAGVKPRTFRLTTQPEVVARELGPRSLSQVPPAELAHHLVELSVGGQLRTEEELFHAVLAGSASTGSPRTIETALARAIDACSIAGERD